MQQSRIEFLIGSRPDSSSGQWIESKITLEREDRFAFQADLCRLDEHGDYSQYRVEEEIDRPLTAELALALLAFVAQPPFAPTISGFSVSISGQSPVANREVIRILQPEIREVICCDKVPRYVRDNLRQKLVRVANYREIQGFDLAPRFN